MAQSQRRLPTAETTFAPWFRSASCVLSNNTTSEVLSYAVLRRACTTMAAILEIPEAPRRVPALCV
jgi:hypothetical protein